MTDIASLHEIAQPARWSQPEIVLLIIDGLFITAIRLALVLVRGDNLLALWPLLLWIGCAAFGYYALEKRAPGHDPLLFPIAMLLAGWGLNTIDRLLPTFGVRQAIWLVIGVTALIGVTYLPRNLGWLSRYRYIWLGGCLLAFNIIALAGSELVILDSAFLRLRSNPTELIKLALLIFFASYIANRHDVLMQTRLRIGRINIPNLIYVLPLLAVWALCALVLYWQHAFGLAILYLIVLILLLYLASARPLYLIGGLSALIIVGIVALIVYAVARQRFAIWLDPWSDSGGTSYQIVQSLMAFASGNVFGQGIGQGAPVYIPVVHSDLIFAAIGEEWGLLGVIAVLVCEATLCVRALRLAVQQRDPFRGLLSAGIGLTFGVQSLLITGGTLKLIPLTGITLPFVSYSGSSLVISLVMLGLLMVISATTPRLYDSAED